MNIHRRAKFTLGKPSFKDPCLDCIVGVVCDKNSCVVKIKYEMNQPVKGPDKLLAKKKKIKKVKLWRNINGIRN